MHSDIHLQAFFISQICFYIFQLCSIQYVYFYFFFLPFSVPSLIQREKSKIICSLLCKKVSQHFFLFHSLRTVMLQNCSILESLNFCSFKCSTTDILSWSTGRQKHLMFNETMYETKSETECSSFSTKLDIR